MAQQKRFQDLNLADAYLFAAALEDAETCRLTLEILLGRKVSHVTSTVQQKLSQHPAGCLC